VGAQYVRFNGPDASDTPDAEVVGAANARLKWRIEPRVWTHVGVGTSMRAAGLTERYFAFAPAPGGFQVGNPTLSPERKTEVEWGGGVERRWVKLQTSVYAHWYRDYIEQTVLLRGDVNGDTNPDIVRGFRNVDARLLGGELQAIGRLTAHLTVPSTFAVVYGHDTTNDQPLAEIPPWEFETGLRFAQGGRHPWWSLVGVRTVGSQDRVDPDFGEDATDGFATVHVRGGVMLVPQVRLEAGVENLLDTTYHEHLTREAALAVGDLMAGDEVPAPGRFVHLSVRAEF
jgi:iron complex outermembrane receptor protein